MKDQLPPEILRVLASSGPVRLTCGEGQTALSVTCHLAPFEDTLFLFVDPQFHEDATAATSDGTGMAVEEEGNVEH